MPDLEVVVEDCIGEERKVFTWSTLIGTIVRPTLGYPASDKVLSISAMGFCVQPAGPVAGAVHHVRHGELSRPAGTADPTLRGKALP